VRQSDSRDKTTRSAAPVAGKPTDPGLATPVGQAAATEKPAVGAGSTKK
jgi:hypothetical protein